MYFPEWPEGPLDAETIAEVPSDLAGDMPTSDEDLPPLKPIAVNRNLMCGIITTRKNHQRRRVDMSGPLADTLPAESLRQRQRALTTGKPRPEAVFPSADGTLVEHLLPLGAWR